jgi:hypothetical protein
VFVARHFSFVLVAVAAGVAAARRGIRVAALVP